MKRRLHLGNTLKGVTAASIAAIAASAQPVLAEEEAAARPTADLTVSALSQYIWRGQELSQDSIVIQPSMTVGYQGFAFNLWGNLDTDHFSEETNNWNETDMTLSYSRSMGMVSLTGGYIYYALDGAEDSQEVFLGLTLDTLLSPTLTVYREFSHYPSWYITAGVSHSFALPYDMSLDLGALTAYLISDSESAYPEIGDSGEPTGDEFSNFHEATLSASISIPVAQYISITPQAYITFPLSDDASDEMQWRSVDGDDDTFIYGGISASLSF